MRNRVLLFASLVLCGIALSGCSISKSVSDMVSSPFESLSGSLRSSSADRSEAYQGDVKDFTETYVRSSDDLNAFRSGLSAVARKHGITNWEADTNTYVGIGRGLKKARVSSTNFKVYKTSLSAGVPEHAQAMQQGYDLEG